MEQHQKNFAGDCAHSDHVLLSYCRILTGGIKDVPAQVGKY